MRVICAWAWRFLILEEGGKTGEAVEDACLDGACGGRLKVLNVLRQAKWSLRAPQE